MQVESSQEACGQAVQEVTERLQRQYEEQLMETQRQHREEIEKLQVCIPQPLSITVSHCASRVLSANENKGYEIA